mmetsp:Transcript_5736/g.19525  ORF Transcript_5736/g.19525 Transcript_5736/m.19525 type:complete len:206 (-) Transcript_5736:426-1043(-)
MESLEDLHLLQLILFSRFCSRLDVYGMSHNGGGFYYPRQGRQMKIHHSSELESWLFHFLMQKYERELGICIYLHHTPSPHLIPHALQPPPSTPRPPPSTLHSPPYTLHLLHLHFFFVFISTRERDIPTFSEAIHGDMVTEEERDILTAPKPIQDPIHAIAAVNEMSSKQQLLYLTALSCRMGYPDLAQKEAYQNDRELTSVMIGA